MAKGPGPRQRFPGNIIRITFPSIGGMIYFRVAQRFSGDIPAPTPTAQVEGLPWDAFNMFNVVGGKKDPDGTPKDPESVSIDDPVTDHMLSKYLYWAQHPAKSLARVTNSTPPTDFFVIDTANWVLVYNHMITARQTTPMTKEAALAQFKSLVGSPGYEDLDPDLMGVGIFTNTGEEFTQDMLIEGAAINPGWSGHYETLPGSTVTETDNVASIIINTGKLFRDVPNGGDGKKPAFIDFTVRPPSNSLVPSGRGRLQWWIQAEAFKDSITKPEDGGPKYSEGERRDFPVRDTSSPVSGIPSATTRNLDIPDVTRAWVDFPNDTSDIREKQGWSDSTVAKVRIVFGVGSVLPKVFISFEDVGGGEIG